MDRILVPFQGKTYAFTYYSTTLNTENIYFVITKDKEAIELLVLDHFFVTMDLRGDMLYTFNAINGKKEEVEFKGAIAKKILISNMKPAFPLS